ncbi:hypothetical protein OBBRIDRAFT_771990 [Obba rivulosa]|uniref:Microtubule associated protein n=1 Tax=Obba rivulosa TaxID=1052685 RepID=A0A8E2DNJ5_9APHY|nr:hypothetical protein OBBRIDRAFT_771990 [Obba rivulosa]
MSSTNTAITSLLNSLHTHLQSQTQILPTLHNQLGLPATALADELSTLQQRLTDCIEEQIDVRRRQVDEWFVKCNGVEGECIRYGKALGGNLKASGTSVGEIRKEQTLPKRYEIICEYQEKLRQIYHTKLEQILSLTGRLKTLANTLGPNFYSDEVLDPALAPDEDEDDPTSHRDVTPERFAKLERELVRGKGEVAKRLSQLSATMIQIDWLHTELGIAPPTVDDLRSAPLASSSRTVHSSSNTRSSYADPFLSASTASVALATPTPGCRSRQHTPLLLITAAGSDDDDDPKYDPEAEYLRIFSRFVARMEEASEEDLDTNAAIGLEGVNPTPSLLAWAESTRLRLEETKRKREAQIQAMYDQLEALWRRLGVTDREMDAFVEANRGSTEDTVRAYEEELERMLELKRERMGAFVENARAEIIKLWDELMVGEEERADFAPFADDEHTEELLSIHEDEIRRLKEERRLKGPLLASIRKYFDICEDEKELAAAANDQSRLLGRGPRDPGRLLREEKMRKRVTKEKPRLEQDLLASIPAWEAESGRVFRVHGESILQLLMETGGTADKENNGRKSKQTGRAGSVPARATTPLNAAQRQPPVSGAGKAAVTPAVRAGSTATSRSVPGKRAKLGESTAHNNAGPRMALRSSSSSSSRHADTERPPSPFSKIPSKTPTATSSLPRKRTATAPIPRSISRPGALHNVNGLGHGRAPSRPHHAHSYHPYPMSHRTASHASIASSRTYGAAEANIAAVARKASRARRESFKPRSSVDEAWPSATGLGAPDMGGAVRKWTGFSGAAVKEEDEGL